MIYIERKVVQYDEINVSLAKIFSIIREVQDDEKLPLKNVIFLPPTQVKDHFRLH